MVLEVLYQALIWKDVDKARSYLRQALRTEGLKTSIGDIRERETGNRWGVIVYIETERLEEWIEINTMNGEIAYKDPVEVDHELMNAYMATMVEEEADDMEVEE